MIVFGESGECDGLNSDGPGCTRLECSFNVPGFHQCNLSRVKVKPLPPLPIITLLTYLFNRASTSPWLTLGETVVALVDTVPVLVLDLQIAGMPVRFLVVYLTRLTHSL